MPELPDLRESGVIMLAFWDCGHVEVDNGREHACDGRDVCTATYERFVPGRDASTLTAEQCMFRAFDALRGAAERFAQRGDEDMARSAAELADGVADLDPSRTPDV